VEGVLRLLGTLVLALQNQGTAAGTSDAAVQSQDLLTSLSHAGAVELAVLVTLLIFSAGSWGIIIFKKMQLARAAKQTVQFLDVFRKSSRFSEVQAVCANVAASPLVGLFQAGYAELNAQLRSVGDQKPGAAAARPTLRSLESVDRALLRASTAEISKLEQRMTFLATTASISPYIGLFGTVWGIMMSFQSIAAQGSTSLGVVAPGISQALIATAAGLFAAIPAVYFYNDILSNVKKFSNEMDDFSMEFLTIAERNFT